MLQYFENETFNVRKPQADAIVENVSRRSVLGGILGGTGLVLSVRFAPASAREALQLYPTGADDMPNKWVSDPKVFVAIDLDGTVTIVTHRPEMGTGIRTSLPAVVADEMEADWSRVRLTQAEGDEPRYGNQDTDGSRSMRHFIQAMRTCGASMRHMLETAAAIKWNVESPLCVAKNHRVHLLDQDKKETGKSLGFGELAALAMTLPVPAQQTLLYKTPDEFTLIGKGQFQIADLHDITTGKAHYGADTRLPGMKYAVMARPPVLGGKLKTYDASKALKVPGVEAVYEIEGVHTVPRVFGVLGGVAVVANSTYAAIQGRDALVIEWEDGPNASYNSPEYDKEMTATAAEPGKVLRNQGDVDAAFASAKQVFTADYHAQHMVQAPMEPLVAVARVAGGKAEVWAPIQSPWGARKDLATALKMPLEDVTVHVTLLGGGFGRKSKWDYMVEAALVSVGLDPGILRRYPHEFSGGQRQRIAIARAIVPKPKLLLADEAVSALDLSTKVRIVELLKDLASGMTLVFVSHDLGVVAALCDEIVILEHGRIVEAGPTRKILDHPQHDYTKALLASVPRMPGRADSQG